MAPWGSPLRFEGDERRARLVHTAPLEQRGDMVYALRGVFQWERLWEHGIRSVEPQLPS